MSESQLTQYIQCDVELQLAGPSEKVVNGWTVKALRQIADTLERDEYVDGHHDVTDRHGKRLGTVYFDFTEGFHVDEADS